MRTGTKLTAKEIQNFLAHIDAVAEPLRPARRPQDRDAPECSRQELRVLNAIGEHRQMTMTAIASAIGVTLSTATHTIGKLVMKGLVERVQDRHDRRVVHVKFSRKGRAIHKYVVESRRQLGQAMLERLDPGSRARFLDALEAITGTRAAKFPAP